MQFPDLPLPFLPSPSALLKKQFPIYPFLGLLATLFGTWFAIDLIPTDFYPAGALFPSAVVITVGLCLAPVVAGLRHPRSLLRAEHLLVLAPIYWLLLDLLQSAYNLKNIDHASIEAAFVAIGVFVAGIWISALFSPWQLPKTIQRAASHTLTPPILFSLILVFFSLAIFRFAYPCNFNPMVMLFYLGQNRWAAPWKRGALGGTDAFLDHFSYFGFLLPTLTTLLFLRNRRVDLRLLISVVLTLTISVFLAQGGSRRVVGVIFGSAILCWILEQARLTIRQLLGVVLSVTILLTAMQYMLEFRAIGFQALVNNKKQEQTYKHLHVDDNFLRLSQIIYLVPKDYPYLYEKQILYTLVRPIPRVLWPGKPISAGFDLAQAQGLRGVSLSSSVIGEWYLSFGWLGVLFGGWFYGRLASMTSLLLLKDTESAHSIVYSLMAMTLFAGMRSMLDLMLMSYAVLAWIFISWIILRHHQSQSQVNLPEHK